jgi:predicted nucleotide-binding protein
LDKAPTAILKQLTWKSKGIEWGYGGLVMRGLTNEEVRQSINAIKRIEAIAITTMEGRKTLDPTKRMTDYAEFHRQISGVVNKLNELGIPVVHSNPFDDLMELDAYLKSKSSAWSGRREILKGYYAPLRQKLEEILEELEQKTGGVNLSEIDKPVKEKIRAGREKNTPGEEIKAAHPVHQTDNTAAKDPKKVWVVHGRNENTRQSLFNFLRSIGLYPVEWSQAVAETGKGTPYTGEVLDKAFQVAQAVVVLMTPDDIGYLRKPFRKQGDPDHETKPTPQARLNVLFEAGMAFGHYPDRTILVELGKLRDFSDVGGRHVIRLDNSSEKRQDLAQRLQAAGCPVDLSGRDWHTVGNFGVDSGPDEDEAAEDSEIDSKGKTVRLGTLLSEEDAEKIFESERTPYNDQTRPTVQLAIFPLIPKRRLIDFRNSPTETFRVNQNTPGFIGSGMNWSYTVHGDIYVAADEQSLYWYVIKQSGFCEYNDFLTRPGNGEKVFSLKILVVLLHDLLLHAGSVYERVRYDNPVKVYYRLVGTIDAKLTVERRSHAGADVFSAPKEGFTYDLDTQVKNLLHNRGPVVKETMDHVCIFFGNETGCEYLDENGNFTELWKSLKS